METISKNRTKVIVGELKMTEDVKLCDKGPTVLEKANSLIYQDRAKEHGQSAIKQFSSIAYFWTDYLACKYNFPDILSPEDVCWMMTLLKLCRSMDNPKNMDNYVDAAGYIGLIEKINNQNK